MGDRADNDLFYFNPRAYVRHDVNYLAPQLDTIFQSTCLREARRATP